MARDKLIDRMTGTSAEQVDAIIRAATDAWETEELAYVCVVRALASVEAGGLNQVVNRVLSLGWDLHSTALGATTIAVNTQYAMFVFTRPVRP